MGNVMGMAMRPIVTDGVASVIVTACHSSEPCQAVELIEMSFRLRTPVCQRNHVLPRGAHWRHLANTIERLCAAVMWPVAKLLGPLVSVAPVWMDCHQKHCRCE